MSTDFLTIGNSLLAEYEKIKYLDKLSVSPWPDEAPLFSVIPKNQNENSRSPRWKLARGTLDGIGFRSTTGAINLKSGTDEGDEATVDMKAMDQYIKINRFTDEIMKGGSSSAIHLMNRELDNAAKERALAIEHMILRGQTTGAYASVHASSSITDNGGGSYTVPIALADQAYGLWRPRMMLQFASSTDVFDLTDVDDSATAPTITIQRRTGGSHVPANSESIYRVGAKDNYPVGLKEIIEGTGNLFGIPRKFGWQSLKSDWTNVSISEQALLELFMKTFQRCGEYPDTLILSTIQFVKLQEVLRAGMIHNRSVMVTSTLKGGAVEKIEIPNVKHLSIGNKDVKLLVHPMMPAGAGYFANVKHLELRSVGPGQFIGSAGKNKMTHLGVHTGEDSYAMLWSYYFCLVCYKPEAFSGFVNAPTDTALDLIS